MKQKAAAKPQAKSDKRYTEHGLKAYSISIEKSVIDSTPSKPHFAFAPRALCNETAAIKIARLGLCVPPADFYILPHPPASADGTT
jgi:hypothetical protein